MGDEGMLGTHVRRDWGWEHLLADKAECLLSAWINGFASSWFCLHIKSVAGTRQFTLQSLLVVRGRPVLKTLHDSGLAPKCNIHLLRTHLRSCRTMFTESTKKKICWQKIRQKRWTRFGVL